MNRHMRGVTGCAVILLVAGILSAQDLDAEKATHKEAENIATAEGVKLVQLGSLTMNADGNLLAGDLQKKVIKVLSPEGKLLETWNLPLTPYVIHQAPDGTIFIGGWGELAKLDKSGKVLKTAKAADAKFPNAKISGLATMGDELFAAFGSPGTLRSRSNLVRLDRDFGGAKVIAEDLRGCCQRLDMTSKDGVLYVAENSRHRVVKYDREGKMLSKWGQRDRRGIEGFGSCCNPMNVQFGPDGSLYTAETGLGRVKRYSVDGEYLGLVGYIGVARFSNAGGLAASCSNIAFAVNADAGRIYIMDYKQSLIRVLVKK